MKILFVSHLRESTGNGQASRDLVLAMDSVGLDVVPRTVKLGTPTPENHSRILELESKSSQNCDVCLQFLLQHQMRYDRTSFKKCIAYFDYEFWQFQTSSWPYLLEQFDEVWVPNNDAVT